MKISIIIPIYNESENIPILYTRLHEVVSRITDDHELIFINDGSKDNSFALIKELIQKDSKVKYIDLSRNFGHQIAVSAGIDHAQGDAVVLIDADLQDPPELIADMVEKWEQGYEVVYAKRKIRKGEKPMKRWTAKMFYRLLDKMTSIKIPVDTGDFRLMDRKVVDVLKNMPEQHKFLRGQVAWAGFDQTYIEYDRQERNAGTTGYTYRKMIRFALDGITSFSDVPLKIATLAGFMVSAIAFLLILYTLYSRFISRDYVEGWASLMISVMFIGGIQLFCIGIIGEYLSRISSNVRSRPLYIVRSSNMIKE